MVKTKPLRNLYEKKLNLKGLKKTLDLWQFTSLFRKGT